MSLTEVEVRRLLEILGETVGQPIQHRLARVEQEMPHANQSDIRTALQLILEIKKLETVKLDPYRDAADKLLQAWQRAEALSGKQDMDLAEAETYLHELARGGNEEAKKTARSVRRSFRWFWTIVSPQLKPS